MTISIHFLPITVLIILVLLTYFCHYVLKDKFHSFFLVTISTITFILNILWYVILFIIWFNKNITITY
jgi:hypothetical protein